MKKNDLFLLITSLLVPLLAGFIGSLFTVTGPGTWYASLTKPFFNPPDWLFAPAWTLLFILMGVALFLICRRGRREEEVISSLKLFFIQLSFNIIWSYFFFTLQNPRLAFFEIIALWLAIVANILAFRKIDRRAAYLLFSYLLWVSFAACLNYSIWRLN
jgi:tryptophan-rich sensory protein